VAQCVTPGTALLDPDDKDVQQGLYLNVTETVLKKIFPRPEHLALLAHVREVDVPTPSSPAATTTAGSRWCSRTGCRCSTTRTASRCATWRAC
jgi:hypothetical protein